MVIQLRPHQRAAVNKLSNGKILWGGVGSGKTYVAATYYNEKEAPKDVYVITTAKKRDTLDWDRSFANIGVGRQVGGTTQGLLTVDSWNNVGKYAGVKGAFFIFDEQRIVGSGQWSSKFLQIAKNNNWILLSATPGDTWMDYIPVFVANGFYKNRTDFKRKHVIYNTFAKFPKVDRYVGVATLVRHRQSLLVEMPYIKHTVRKSITVPVLYDGELMNRVVIDRWHVYEDRPIRDIAEMFSVMRKVANTDSSRISALSRLMTKHPKMILFYNFNYELELLRKLGKTLSDGATTQSMSGSPPNSNKSSETTSIGSEEFTLAQTSSSNGNISESGLEMKTLEVREWNGHKHEDLPTGDRWLYLVQYVAGAEGWDCTTTNVTCFYSLPYSYKVWEQAHGRTDRLSTPFTELLYYQLLSNSPIDKGAQKALKEKRDFQPVRNLHV